jgi:hypothetical protein
MDHKLAQQTKTIDKYLLDELTLEERQAFEEHMFDCPDCAAQVQSDFAMIDGLKEVLREPVPVLETKQQKAKGSWRDWFRPMTLAPACAALVLACTVGYQNMISIPKLLEPQVVDLPPALTATTRGTTQTVPVRPGAALLYVSFAVDAASVFPGYVCEFEGAGGATVITMDCGKHHTAEFTLSLKLPSAKLPAGVYTMILRPASDQHTEVGRYSFVIKGESQ